MGGGCAAHSHVGGEERSRESEGGTKLGRECPCGEQEAWRSWAGSWVAPTLGLSRMPALHTSGKSVVGGGKARESKRMHTSCGDRSGGELAGSEADDRRGRGREHLASAGLSWPLKAASVKLSCGVILPGPHPPYFLSTVNFLSSSCYCSPVTSARPHTPYSHWPRPGE